MQPNGSAVEAAIPEQSREDSSNSVSSRKPLSFEYSGNLQKASSWAGPGKDSALSSLPPQEAEDCSSEGFSVDFTSFNEPVKQDGPQLPSLKPGGPLSEAALAPLRRPRDRKASGGGCPSEGAVGGFPSVGAVGPVHHGHANENYSEGSHGTSSKRPQFPQGVNSGGSSSPSTPPKAKVPNEEKEPGEPGWIPPRRTFRSTYLQGGVLTEGTLKFLMPRDLHRAQNNSNGESKPNGSGGMIPRPPAPENGKTSMSLRKRRGVERSVDFGNSFPRPPASGESGRPKPDEESEGENQGHLSESSENRLSEESSDEEDGDNPCAKLELHPLHLKSLGDGQLHAKLFAPVRPLRLPGRTDANELAKAVAAHQKLERHPDHHGRCRFAVVRGKLVGATCDFTVAIELGRAQIGCAAAEPHGTDTSIITLVLKKPGQADPDCGYKPESISEFMPKCSDSKDSKTAPNLCGWLLYCPTSACENILDALLANGGFRIGLQKLFEIDKDAKNASGTFGFVVPATRRGAKGPVVAIKMLKETARESVIENEVAMLVLAQGHPNIVKYMGCVWDASAKSEAGQWSMIFEFHGKGDLYDLVSEGPRMMEVNAMSYMHDLLLALQHLQEHEIFHRDVKPENILLTDAMRAVLTDFGIATLTTNSEEMKKSSGTIGYASPEMLAGEATGCQGDVFGAGIVLYFMLSRSTPFFATTRKLMVQKTHTGTVNLNYSVFDHISEGCRAMMLGFIKRDVKERLKLQDALKMKCLLPKGARKTEPALSQLVRLKPTSSANHSEFARESDASLQGNQSHGGEDNLRRERSGLATRLRRMFL